MSSKWYSIVNGDDLAQGDILPECPTFHPPAEWEPNQTELEFEVEEYDLIVLTQTCDLVKGREKVKNVLVCPVQTVSELRATGHHLASKKNLEKVRRGELDPWHMLNSANFENVRRDLSVVGFQSIYTMPIKFLRSHAARCGPRLRLNHPYREHLGQAFARYVMRIGLPDDISKFA